MLLNMLQSFSANTTIVLKEHFIVFWLFTYCITLQYVNRFYFFINVCIKISHTHTHTHTTQPKQNQQKHDTATLPNVVTMDMGQRQRTCLFPNVCKDWFTREIVKWCKTVKLFTHVNTLPTVNNGPS